MSAHTPFRLRRRAVLGLTAGLAGSASFSAFAQTYPMRPVKFIVPYAPGGGTDLLIRSLQDPLARALRQPVIVDNRSGAAGAIGAREVARAAPDGLTFLVSNNGPSIIAPLLQKDAGYDPVKDFTPITTIATAPIVLIAHPSVPAHTVRKFIEWGTSQADGVAYASAGIGSIGHLAAEQFAKLTKLKFVHIPYRGQAPTIMAVLSGESPIGFTSASDTLMAYVQTGKIRLLGVGSEQPSALIPDGQPIAAAVPGYRADFWQGVLAPARTPEAIVNRMHSVLVEVLKAPEMQQKFIGMSYTASYNQPAQFARMVADEAETWRGLIRERGIRAES